MFDEFKSRAEVVSAEVHRFATKDEALMFIIDILKKEGVSDSPGAYAVWADCPFLKGIDLAVLAGKVPGLTFEITRATVAASRVGISQIDWALAGTGALVQNSTSVEQRLVSTLPLIHIALIATDRILSDLEALLTKVSHKGISFDRAYDFDRLITVFVDELGVDTVSSRLGDILKQQGDGRRYKWSRRASV